MSPVVEQIMVNMIKAQLYYGIHYDTVCQRFGVSKTYLRKKCGWRSGKVYF